MKTRLILFSHCLEVFKKNNLTFLLFFTIFSITIFAQVPSNPPVATADTGVTQTSFYANWNAVGTATGYILEVGTTPGGHDIDSVDAGNNLTYQVTVSSGITYYSRVFAYNINGVNTTPSDTISVITIPANPTATAATLITSTSFQANWNSVTGAASYRLDVGTTSGGHDIDSSIIVAGTSAPVTGLTPNTEYFYQVRAVDAGGTSGNSNIVNLTTLPPAPVLSAPANTLTGVSIEPLFSWSWSGVGSVTFDLIIQDITAGSPVDTIYGLSTTGSYSHQLLETELALINNHEYSWQIRANQVVSVTSSANTFYTSVTAAAALTTPDSGITVYNYTPILFTWNIGSAIGSLTFKVQYLKNSNLLPGHTAPNDSDWAAGTTVNLNPTSGISIDTVNLLAGTEYWWRVVTLRGTDIISYSSAAGYSFKTSGGTLASAGIPSWPVGGPIVYTNAPTLSWYINSGDLTGITFEVVISTNSNLTAPTVDSTGITSLYYNISPALTAGTTYYWAVITHGTGDVTTDTSTIESFTTRGTGSPLLPVLSYPTGGVQIYTQSPSFFWFLTSATNGITYKVYIDSVYNGSVTDMFSFTTDSILTPGKHTWYVTATNGIPALNQTTAPDSFVVAGGTTEGLPIGSWPIGNPFEYTTTPLFTWYINGSTIGLTNFVVAWNTSSLGPNGDWQGLPNTEGTSGVVSVPDTTFSYTLLNSQALNYGQIYYWAVASFDGSHYSTWSVDTFSVTGVSGSSVPIPSYPINGVPVYSTTDTLSWYVDGSTLGINHYEVIYSARADMDTTDHANTFEVNVPDTLQYVGVSGLVPGTTYYWKAGSSPNNSAPTTFSSVATFVVAPITSPNSAIVPLIGSPNHGVGLSQNSAVLSWVIPVKSTGSFTYQLQYSNNSNMSNSTTISGIKKPSQIINGLAADKVFYWRVQSVNSKGQLSAYSELGQFSTKSSVTAVTSNSSALPKEFAVSQNYPNPFNPSTLINYALPKSSLVTIKIYNILGQEVKTLVNSQLQAGNYTAQWNGDNNFGRTVASGVYIYQVKAGQFVKTMKMMLLK
jgi:hypothetical protein